MELGVQPLLGERSMTIEEMEKKIEILEDEVKKLKCAINARSDGKDWRTVVGIFADDPLFDEIVAHGKRIRHQDREVDDE